MAKFEDYIKDVEGDQIRVIAFDAEERERHPIFIGMEGSYAVALTVEQAKHLIDILNRAIATAETPPSASPPERAT